MYRGYSVLKKKFVFGNDYETRQSIQSGEEKSYIMTEKGKVQVYTNSISKNLFMDHAGYDVFSNDIVVVENGVQMKRFWVCRYGDSYYFIDDQKKNYHRDDLKKIFGKYCITKVGNRFEEGRF